MEYEHCGVITTKAPMVCVSIMLFLQTNTTSTIRPLQLYDQLWFGDIGIYLFMMLTGEHIPQIRPIVRVLLTMTVLRFQK